jgi:NitT/TauT family transport system permease protein
MAFRLLRWDARTFPSPGQVAGAIARLLGRGAAAAAATAQNGALLRACGISLLRLAIGFFFTALVGVILGLATWRWAELDRFLSPLFVGLQSLPSVCWVPLALLLPGLGANERGVTFVTVMGSTFAVALNLRDGLGAIPGAYQRAGLMLGADGWRLYRYILLPASLPALATSLRLGFSFAWRSLMGAEVLFRVAGAGLGMLLAAQKSDTAQIVAIMAIMVLIGMTVDRWVFMPAQRLVTRRYGER